ncbi:MAG: hypothetical protein WC445_00490 [Patescibacteria group bacterium]
MPINNPSGEQHAEQLRMHGEELRDQFEKITQKLNAVFGADGYSIDTDGFVVLTNPENSLTEAEQKTLVEGDTEVHRIYDESKKLGLDIFRRPSDKIH